MMVTTLGAAGVAAGRAQAVSAHATAMPRYGILTNGSPWWATKPSAALQQDDTRKAFELFPFLFRRQFGKQIPEPRQRHRTLQAQGLGPRRAVFCLEPAVRSEELRALGWSEPKGRVPLLEFPAPALGQHLQESR